MNLAVHHQPSTKFGTRPEKAVDTLLVDLYIQAQPRPPERIVLDLDATDDPVHGQQEGRFLHGYYGNYCYLPLSIFIGDHLVCARLRPSSLDASAGALEEVGRIVAWLRRRWPEVQIALRADSGFCREALMSWCEGHGVDFTFGLAKNERLRKAVGEALEQARQQWQQTGQPARVFVEFLAAARRTVGAGCGGWWPKRSIWPRGRTCAW